MSMNNAKNFWNKYSVYVSFVIVFIVAWIVGQDSFMNQNNLANILRQASVIGIISLGQTVVILTGGLDLSVGSVLALVGGFGLIAMGTGNIFEGLFVAVLLGLIVGTVNGLFITKAKVAPFIVTLGMMSIARSVILYKAQAGTIIGKDQSFFSNFGMGTLLGISYSAYIFIICAILVSILLKKTKFGRYLYAIGSNEKAAHLSAVRVDRVKLLAYILCSGLTGIAAFLESTHLGAIASSSSGMGYELDSIAAVVIGGTRLSGGKGTVWGTFIGVLIMVILNNVINLIGVDPNLQGLVKGAIIIIAVFLQKKE